MVPIQKVLGTRFTQKAAKSHESDDIGRSSFLDVMGGDDNGQIVLFGQENKVIPDGLKGEKRKGHSS